MLLICSHSFDTLELIVIEFSKIFRRDGLAMTREVGEPLKVSEFADPRLSSCDFFAQCASFLSEFINEFKPKDMSIK